MSPVFIVIFAVLLAPMLLMGLFLLTGRGASLLSGYNTMSKEEQSVYDEKSLCHSAGRMLIGISAGGLLIPSGAYLKTPPLSYGGAALLLLGIAGHIAYLVKIHRSKQSSTDGLLPKKSAVKKGVAACAAVILAVFFLLGILFTKGDQDPAVRILEDGIQIEAMYGLHVGFAEIREISLIEKSMREIGVGRKTNGYNGFGQALKGSFYSDSLGDTLLFVQSETPPTIRIARDEKDIYLSFQNGGETRALFEDLSAAFLRVK